MSKAPAKKKPAPKPESKKKSFQPTPEYGQAVLKRLKSKYGHIPIGLEFGNPLELLISTILSAQCTDERVNKVTPALFARLKTAKDFATVDIVVLEELIRSTGFYHNKAKNIQGAARAILAKHGGKVPSTMEELIELPGVGRKTANVVMAHAFATPVGVVVDTHVGRLSGLLGFTSNTDPVKVEQDLIALFPKKDWAILDMCLIWHGRSTCIARRPKYAECVVNDLCPSAYANDKAKTKATKN